MGDEPDEHDLVELGGRPFRLPGWLSSRLPGWRPPRGAGAFAAATLAVGLVAGIAVGYAAGDNARGGAVPESGPGSAAPSASPAATFSFAGSPALTQDTGACSLQQGQDLVLGIQLTNQSTKPLTLTTTRAVLPFGGLKQVTWQWATCGALEAPPAQADAVLMPGESTWMAVTFTVREQCPGPVPVQFSVGYLVRGKPVTASLPGFPDLSQVPFSGCSTATTSNAFASQDRLLTGVDRWLLRRERLEG
jgi:hypothetical protein